MGNLFYTLSIVISPFAWPSEGQGSEDAKAFLMSALPFLIGSAGTLFFDITIISQWAWYRPNTPLFNLRFSFQRRHTETSALRRDNLQDYGSIASTH